MNVNKLLLGGAGLGAGGLVMEEFMQPKEKHIELEETKVEIQVATLNEKGYIRECLKSLREQPLYRTSHKVDIVVLDSGSDDGTLDIAHEYADRVINCPKGKVSARDVGYRESNADIVVSTDADARFPKYWLSNLIAPFEDPEVVATHGPSLTDDRLWRVPKSLYTIYDSFIGKILGQNMAIRRIAYINQGGYNTNIDESDFETIQNEEEYRMHTMMQREGKIEWVWTAPTISSTRRRLISEEKIKNPEKVRKYHKRKEKHNTF